MKSGSKVKAWFEKLIKDLRTILDKAYNILKGQKSWEQMELIRNNKQTLDMIADYYFEGMEGTKGKAANKNSTSYSLKYDIFGTPFVQVEEDILSGVPKNKWIKTVNAELSRRFPNGIKVGNNVININNRSRREMTFSEYSKWLMRSEPSLFADKLRAVSNADDVIFASRDYVNEALKHPRKDNIREFARGSVNLRIGNNDYSAEVVVGTTKGEAMLLYDILDLQPIQIKTKKDAATSKRQNAARRNATSKYNMPQSPENVKLSAKDSGADIREVNPMEITPLNRVTSSSKYHYLINEFENNGYNGRRVVLIENGNDGYKALTGSHRILAAQEAGVDVPSVVIPMSEEIQPLLDATGDEERARIADELYEDGIIPKEAHDLLVREDELNYENSGKPLNKQVRFSMKDAVEEARDLIAVHNLDGDQLARNDKPIVAAFQSTLPTRGSDFFARRIIR